MVKDRARTRGSLMFPKIHLHHDNISIFTLRKFLALTIGSAFGEFWKNVDKSNNSPFPTHATHSHLFVSIINILGFSNL